jgi:hypothetical protein
MQNAKLEKSVWTVDDFEKMNWHDCPIYAVAFPANIHEIWMDIDYIFEWIKPEIPTEPFNFFIAPATLVFENIHDLSFDFDVFSGMEIDSILRDTPGKPPNASVEPFRQSHLWSLIALRI